MMSFEQNLRILFPLEDGLSVEAVYYGSGTLCISSQAGCAVGCPFCASGSRGLGRNLTPREMSGQVRAARERGILPARVTLSGIGDPLHNPEAAREFRKWCREEDLPLSLTTTGGPLRRLAEFLPGPDNGLMISVHAGSPAVHRRLIPCGPDFSALWSCLADAWPGLSRRRRRKIGINYLLLAGINDSAEEIGLFIERLRPFPDLTVHLLSLNPVPGGLFLSPPSDAVDLVHGRLAAEGMHVRRSNRWRRQAEGGCGTLLIRRPGLDRISSELC